MSLNSGKVKMVPHLCDFLDLHLVGGRCPARVTQIAAACISGKSLCLGSRLTGTALRASDL